MSHYPPAPGPPDGSYRIEPPPPNHMVMAIVTTILCCLPFGIVSLVYANRVNTLWHSGDRSGALEASKKAKTWWLVALISGIAVGVLYFGLVAAGMFAFSTSGVEGDSTFGM